MVSGCNIRENQTIADITPGALRCVRTHMISDCNTSAATAGAHIRIEDK